MNGRLAAKVNRRPNLCKLQHEDGSNTVTAIRPARTGIWYFTLPGMLVGEMRRGILNLAHARQRFSVSKACNLRHMRHIMHAPGTNRPVEKCRVL